MEGSTMKPALLMPFNGSTSAPADAVFGSGDGSITASLIAHGIAVSRHTPQGSMKPCGQDTGTADDNTVIESGNVVSNSLWC